MDLASVVAALASVGVRVSGSAPNSSVQVDSSRACPTGLAGPEPSGTINDPGQHFQHLFQDPLIKEATMRGAVTQALHRHLTKHTESPMEAAAHLQLEAVRRAAAQMVHRKHLLLTHAEQLTDPTAREHMQRLIHYHAVHDPDVH